MRRLICLAIVLTGCATGPTTSVALAPVTAAYHAGDYASSYQRAVPLTSTGSQRQRDQAAYMAGLSAYQLGDLSAATRWLTHASRSRDRRLVADALATLGIVHSQRGDYTAAVDALHRAADRLDGQDRANAYLYAGIAQQKLGQWQTAQQTLGRARAGSDDPAFQRRVSQQMAATGFALQLGAFSQRRNAQQAALDITGRAARLRLGQPRLVTTAADRGQLTLVHLGVFDSYAAAVAARTQLGTPDATIVPIVRR